MTADLVSRAKSGDADAMGRLLLELGPKVHRFGLKLCRSAEDAEDATQETLLHLATRLGDFQERAALSSYAYALVRSACHRKRRGLKNQPHEPLSEALTDRDESPEQRVAKRELSDQVTRALDSLPTEYREVLWLRDAEGLTAPEAAEALGDTVSAIKSRLHRARKALKDALLPVLAPSVPTGGCPDVAELLSQKLEGELSQEACAEMEAHLRTCDHCDAACEALKHALAACRSASDQPVPETVRRAVEVALAEYRAAAST